MGALILQEGHLQCYTWPTHSNEPQRHSGLGRSLAWHCSPWHSSPYTFENPTSARQHLVRAGAAAKVYHERSRVWPLLWGMTLWEMEATPCIGHTVTPVQALQGRWGCAQTRLPWLSWGYSCTTLQGWFFLRLHVPANASWKTISSECQPAPKGIYETCLIKDS